MVPVSYLAPLLNQLSVSTGEDRHYRHVVIQRRDCNLVLRFLNSTDGPDFVRVSAVSRGVDAGVMNETLRGVAYLEWLNQRPGDGVPVHCGALGGEWRARQADALAYRVVG